MEIDHICSKFKTIKQGMFFFLFKCFVSKWRPTPEHRTWTERTKSRLDVYLMYIICIFDVLTIFVQCPGVSWNLRSISCIKWCFVTSQTSPLLISAFLCLVLFSHLSYKIEHATRHLRFMNALWKITFTRPSNIGLVFSGVSLTSWGSSSLALVGHPSSDGATIKLP